MFKTIEGIFEALSKIERLIDTKDPSGIAWDLRITSIYKIFRAFDIHRFQLQPADPKLVLSELRSLITQIEQTPAVASHHASASRIGYDEKSAEEKSRRMQFLYGLAWAQLSRDQYYDAAALLYRRIYNSNLDISFLQDADCLDIATGIGRYALAMVQLGAKKVVGIDFSKECLQEAQKRLEGSLESRKITLLYQDLYKMPKKMDEAFDFVCANGVIHHLPNPAGGLEVTARCTKKGGHAFVFVFSKNDAPWWPSIELMRKIAKPVPIDYAHKILSFYEIPGTKVFNTLDYSYTPIQHKLDKAWVEDTLRSVGFSELKQLEGGVIHDAVLRCKLFEADRHLFGVSEIRYLLKK